MAYDPQVARTIVNIGRQRGLGEREIVAALSTGLVESGLQNVSHGDRDSLGVFQQRPSQGWGTPQQVQDVEYATNKFFDAVPQFDQPGISGAELAARVQRPAAQFRGRYADRWDEAAQIYNQIAGGDGAAMPTSTSGQEDPGQLWRTILTSLADTAAGGARRSVEQIQADLEPTPEGVDTGEGMLRLPGRTTGESAIDTINRALARWGPEQQTAEQEPVEVAEGETAQVSRPGDPMRGSGNGTQLVEAAKGYLGTPYVWGGTSEAGLDCSGLVQLAARQLGVELPRVSRDQAKAGRDAGTDPEGWQPGDLIAFDAGGPKNTVNHIGILAGRDDQGRWLMVHAPRKGRDVEVVPMTRDDVMAVRRII